MTERHPLGVLITTTREVNQWSLEDVANRARAKGYPISRSNLSLLANQPIESVTARQVETLAAGLNLPPRTVLNAFLASMGLSYDSSGSGAEDAIRADSRLSSDERDLLVDLLRLVRRRRNRRPSDVSTGPPTT